MAVRRGFGYRKRVDLRVDRGYLVDVLCFFRADVVDDSRRVHRSNRDGNPSLDDHGGPPGIRRSRETRVHRAGLQRYGQRDSVRPVGNAAVEHVVEPSQPDRPDRSGARRVRCAGCVPGRADAGTFTGAADLLLFSTMLLTPCSLFFAGLAVKSVLLMIVTPRRLERVHGKPVTLTAD